jgi:CubicO group peptidase (beta-lactamase class C family)
MNHKLREFEYLFLLIIAVVLLAEGACAADPGSFRKAAAYSAAHRGLSFLVIKDNRIVFEDYPNGGGRDNPCQIYSGTKGFWCVAAAAAAQDGILDFNELVRNTITEWASQPDKSGIRVRDLLNFMAGIDPAFSLHGKRIQDRNGYSIQLRAVVPRGESFMYGPSQLQIFSELLRRKLFSRHLSPQEYLTRRILLPLGIQNPDFREDARGHPLLASGFHLSAWQWAQLGILILNDGKYGWRQIVRADYLQELFRGTRINPMFGMGFWLNRTANDSAARDVDVEKMLELPWQRQVWRGACLCTDAPTDMIAAIGSGYQRMFILPSQRLIIVRQGRDDERFSDARFLRIIVNGL